MLEALILTLREGVEAALVVGIIFAFLRKQGEGRFQKAVWSGIGAACLASLAGAYLLYRLAVNEEAFEGVLYLASAVMVASLVVWMWRHSSAVAGEMRSSLARIFERESSWQVWGGLFLFTFLMVFREGVETALFLSALSLNTHGLLAFLGAVIGLGAAVVFGVLFVRGSVRVDLGRFFRITGIALMIFVVQLLFNGYHELSEAGWVPANEQTMALIGPLVRNEFFFLAAVLLLPILLLLIPGRKAEAEVEGEEGAAARLRRAQARRLERARLVGGSLGVLILGILGAGFVYSQPAPTLSAASPVELEEGSVRLPLATFEDGALHRFAAHLPGGTVRFIGLEVSDGEVVTAFDACEICGAKGYTQEAGGVVCLHCHSVIHPPTIGQPGGCNPIPLPSRVEGGELVIAMADLQKAAGFFDGGSAEHQH